MADHTDRTATILHTLPDGTVQHLVLKQVSINAMVVDVSAHVVVSHTFENDTGQATGRAKYVFPVPARAAVCAFTLETSDGKFVIGEVREKSEAEARYRTALDAGQTAGIVHWAGDDVFTISIGSIRARTSAIAKTTFVMTLMEDSRTDEIRFQLPVSIGAARYGLPLPEAQDAGSPESATRVKFSASIQTSGRLLHITSPSHKNWLSVSFHSTHRGGTPSRHRAVASFASSSFLVDDFVLVIRAEGLDAPRCFAEVDHEHGTIALQLSVIPKFDIPKPATQEYLFLLDRSGSMQNGRIKTAKEALKLLLNILPGEGSYMNIFSFGTECDNGLWPMSHSYNPLNIQTARSHIDRMGADMGGTEITHAVTKVLQSRMTSMSTIVYILTDGSVSQPYVDSTVAIVSNSVQQSLLSNAVSPLRVFTLGIGNEVSTPLCEDVARAGRGIALFAVDSSEIIAKCARLVGAGIHPIVTNISVDWNTSLATGSQSAPVIERVLDIDLQPLPSILQSPLQLPTLYRNHRFVVYAILHTVNMPQSVVLRGTLQNGPTQTIELPVRVRVAKRFSSLAYSSSFLHTLAARGVIRDIREHHYPSQVQTIGIASEAIQRAEIIRLGIRYQLVSAFTSFIGVDTGETVQGMRRAWQRRRDNRQRQRRDSVANGAEGGLWDAAVNVVNSTLAWMFSRTQPVSRSRRMPGGLAPSDASSSTSSRHSVSRTRSSDEGLPYEEGEEGYWTDVTVSTMSSLDSHESIAVFRPARQRWVRTRTRYPEPREPSPEMHVIPVTPPLVPRPAPRTQDLRLIELQSFNGSFAASSEVMTIMGRDAHAEAGVAAQLGVTEDVWATVLAVDYLERTLQDQPELLDGLMAKMLDFLERQVGLARFEELRARAKGLKM